MRRSILALFACVPLFVACASESDPIPDPSSDSPEIVGKKDGTPGSDGAGGGGATPGSPGAAGPSGNACIAQPACDGAGGPTLGDKRAFRHTLSNLYAEADAYHRGRDMIYSVGDDQWVIGKMTYSLIDKDLTDEEVDVFVDRGCAGTWDKLGTAITTTNSTNHATIENVADSGGRVYFQIPAGKTLPVGRHRIRLVVAGDQTSTDLVIDVVPKGTKIVVSDVDGTLTSSEVAEFGALLTGDLPAPQPKSADVLSALASKGYRVVYLTARPETLTARTHEFLSTNGFPPGIVHTMSNELGGFGGVAAQYKSEELDGLARHGHVISWAFGNQPSDTDAYDAAHIMPLDHRVFLGITDAHGGRKIDKYADLLPVASKEASICR